MTLPRALVPGRVDELVARCRREVDEGRLPGYQLAVGFGGDVVVFEAYGTAREDQRFHTYSAVKPTVSLTVLELAADGLLDLEAPVASVLSGFGSNGKAAITVSQVLLHAGGFPHAPLALDVAVDRQRRLERYASWRTTWDPGTAFEYHPSSAHWVLGDLIEEVTGRPFADVVTERIMEPAGQGRWLAIPDADQDDIADVVEVGTPPDPVEFEERFGFEMPATEVTNDALLAFNRTEVRRLGVPGGGGVTSAAGFASWYQAILHDDGTILRPDVRRDALTVVRQRHHNAFGASASRTHAFVLAGDDGMATTRGHGHTVGPMAFGHSGARGQLAFADPTSGISFGFMTNGLERDDLLQARRNVAISSKAGLLTTPLD